MWITIRYLLITALRDRLFLGLFIGTLLATLVSLVLGHTAFLENKAMTVTLAAGSTRIMLMVGIIVFICFQVRTAFDNKEIELMLSRPMSRPVLLLAFGAGFWVAAAILVLPISAIIAVLGISNGAGYLAWATSLLMESAVVVALSLFAAFTLRSAVASVIGCLGFYVLSRMMAFFIMTSESAMVSSSQWAFLGELLTWISTLVPRLDMFGKSEWLVYGIGQAQDWWLVVLQTAIFVPLLLLAAMIDFRRREF